MKGDVMKKLMIFSIVVLFLSMLALQGLSRAADKTDNGKDLYNNNCKVCHGVNGDGKGQAAPALKPKPTNFTKSNFWKKNSDNEITKVITKGSGIMQPIALKPDEIKAITEYMTNSFKK
jgi:mono/diheme cytochrome c family protein